MGFFALISLAWLFYVPSFPSSLPSAEETHLIEESYSEQIQFFVLLNREIRGQHGHLVLTSELEKGDIGEMVTYRHVYTRVNEEKLFENFQAVAKENQLLIKIGKKEQGDYLYEFEFSKDHEPWVRIFAKVESVEEGSDLTSIEKVTDKAIVTDSPAESPAALTEEKVNGRLVILVDDMGQNVKVFEKFASLDPAITFSILPHLPHTKAVAQKAAEMKRAVMLHLPMQPVDWPKINPGEGALMVHDEMATTLELLAKNLVQVPNAIGVNNHMGSAFVQYAEGMDGVMKELKTKNLFFLDSKTASGRVAKEAAQNSGVPYLSRDIFLDDNPDPAKVREQLAKAAEMALSRGLVIAICHPRAATFEILKEDLPLLKLKGIVVTPISQVLPGSSLSHR